MAQTHRSSGRAAGPRSLIAALVAALALVACGGGGGSSGGTNNGNNPPPATSPVAGTLYGPVGAQVVLQLNGADDRTVTVPAFGSQVDPYNLQNFAFATPLVNGSAYQASVLSASAGQTCSVFKGASGSVPLATDALHVGCETTDDLVSRNSDTDATPVTGTFFESSAVVIGGANLPIGATTQTFGEGRFVAFVSSAAGLVSGVTSTKRQIYWRDRLSGVTKLVSRNAAGDAGNDDSFAPAISADGLTVAFESVATNLVANDTNAVRDVFVWKNQTQDTFPGVTRESVGAAGAQANSESFEPTLSGDGRVLAFSTGASNLTPGVTGISTINVVRRDLVSGSNTLVSADSGGIGRGGSRPMLSEDGTRLAFWSFSDQLVAGDANGLWDIFVFDSGSGTNQRVSLTSSGGERNQGTDSISRVVSPAISGNGRFVAYSTTASNLVAGDTGGFQDVFVVDTQTGAVTRASLTSAGAAGNGDSPVLPGERVALSYDGTWVAYSSNASNLGAPASNVLLHNRVTGETRVVSSQTTSSVSAPALSRDGGYVAFGTGVLLDSRFASSGLFAHFTNLAPAFWWLP